MRMIWVALAAVSGCESPPPVPPQPLTPAVFRYPEELWDASVEGTTVIRVYVRPDGTADSARVDQGSGYAGFDQAALQGAESLRFAPARQETEPVGAWVRIPVRFRLQPARDVRSDSP